jgi:hypothetical protein
MLDGEIKDALKPSLEGKVVYWANYDGRPRYAVRALVPWLAAVVRDAPR